MNYFLVTDATAEEVKEKAGLSGHNTPFGALVKAPKPFDMYGALAEIDKALNPSRCTCGKFAILHRSSCPLFYAVT